MDNRTRPVYGRQKSNTGTPGTPASPTMTPLNSHHSQTGSSTMSNIKKAQTKAAAQRLAQVMSHQPTASEDVDDDEDDLSYDLSAGGIGSIGLAGGRKVQPRSPLTKPALRSNVQAKTPYQFVDEDSDRNKPIPKTNVQVKSSYNFVDDEDDKTKPAPRTIAQAKTPYNVAAADDDKIKPVGRTNVQAKSPYFFVDDDKDKDDFLDEYSSAPVAKVSIGFAGAKSMRSRSPLVVKTKQEQPQSGHSTSGSRLSSSVKTMEQQAAQIPSNAAPSQTTTIVEQPISARSTITSHLSTGSLDHLLPVRSSTVNRSSTNAIEQPPSARSARGGIKTVTMPSAVPISLKPVSSATQLDSPMNSHRDKRLSLDLGSMKIRDTITQNSSSALQDEIDMLQQENENLLERLRIVEEKSHEADARANQLAQQISTLGQGVTMEARLLSRKEAALQQREAALKVAEQSNQPEMIFALRTEAETAKDEATSAFELLHEAELELRSLRNVVQRMILTDEEMEEVVLKRCWLARYWNLCIEHGIYADIAAAKSEYWSSFVPLPNEIVLAAGQRALDEDAAGDDDLEEREKAMQERHEISGERNIENIFLVEKGMRELTSLKIEDAVALAMAQSRRPNSLKTDELKLLPIEGNLEVFELSKEESEDVRFKQAWLKYFWRRAKNHGIEPDIAEDRLQFWINHSSQSSTSHDAVDVERGLMELRKLGIESQLWQNSRKGLETELSSKAHLEFNF